MQNLNIIECDQNTPTWYKARLSMFTASDASDLIFEQGVYKTGDNKGQPKPVPKSFLNIVKEKRSESKHGITQYEIDTRVGRCLYNDFVPSIGLNGKYGQMMQIDALEHYSKKYNEEVYTVGFVISNKYPDHVGCSPDALHLHKNSGVETKCPVTMAIHDDHISLKTPLDLKIFNEKYYWQVLLSLFVCEAESWDFVSYFPFIEPENVMSCLVIKRDEVLSDLELLDNQIKLAIELKTK